MKWELQMWAGNLIESDYITNINSINNEKPLKKSF